MISDTTGDPSRPPVRGANKEYLRWKLRRIVESIYFRATTLILILVDLVIVTIDLAMGHGQHEGLKVLDFVFSLYFVFEVILRIIALTPATFFLHLYNTADFIIVFCTFIISCWKLDWTVCACGVQCLVQWQQVSGYQGTSWHCTVKDGAVVYTHDSLPAYHNVGLPWYQDVIIAISKLRITSAVILTCHIAALINCCKN